MAKDHLDKFGLGLASVRFICGMAPTPLRRAPDPLLIVWLGTGTQSIHKDLEKKIAEFHKTDDTILYTRYA